MNENLNKSDHKTLHLPPSWLRWVVEDCFPTEVREHFRYKCSGIEALSFLRSYLGRNIIDHYGRDDQDRLVTEPYIGLDEELEGCRKILDEFTGRAQLLYTMVWPSQHAPEMKTCCKIVLWPDPAFWDLLPRKGNARCIRRKL